jgi:response regulator RpfG family c-di-GMP phosphodiesterase
MPGIYGIEVAKEILRINPKQRIIIASAYPRDTLFYYMNDLGQRVEFVQKPLSVSTLIDKRCWEIMPSSKYSSKRIK